MNKKPLRGKKRQAHLLLEMAIGSGNWNTPQYWAWHKKQYGPAFHHWKKKDLTFIGNKAMFLAYQGENKGYHIGTTHSGAYSVLSSLAHGCYFYTNPRVDPGPMRPFFLTELFVRRLRSAIDEKPPKEVQARVWFYQSRAIYLQYLHALALDRGPVHGIDTAPWDAQHNAC